MRFLRLFFLLSGILLPSLTQIGFAQQRFSKNLHIISGHTNRELDQNRILVYIDESNELEIEDILKLEQNDYIEANYLTRFDESNTYWMYYRINDSGDEPLSHILRGGTNAKETYYVVINDQISEHKTGYLFPASERSIPQGHDTKIRIDHPPKGEAHVYVRVQNTDGTPIDLKARLEPYQEWYDNKERVNLFQGFFTGLIIVVAMLNFFLFGFTKQKAFLFFALYCLFNLSYFLEEYGILEVWLYPETANLVSFLKFGPILSVAFYCLFAKEFLELYKGFPFWNRTVKTIAYFSFVFFVLVAGFNILSDNYYTSFRIFEGYMAVASFTAIVFLISINLKPNLLVRYFSMGTTLLIITVLVSAIAKSLDHSFDIHIFIQVGLIIELIVFSIGMSHKLKRNLENHEITQKSLIIQLQNNEKLQLNINQDLTELVAARTQLIKKQNKELEVARNEAEKATQAKSEFLSVMSHEIRTPLNAIISLSHIMEMDNENEEMQEYIDALKFSAENLHSLINDVLDYNKIEADKLVLETIEFSVIDLLRNIRDSFKYKAKNQGIELLVEVGEHMPDRVIGDPTRLTQIFNNLIGNAIKFTHEGHVHIKATLLGLKDDIATVTFEVKDTGIGIPREKLETIFEAYEQAGKETTREYGGTGLGLSITQKLLNLMGSKVRIESAEEEGTSLSFDISFMINQAFDMVSLQDQMRDKDLHGKHILVVDDNDMNRLVLKRLLTSWNAQFDEANGGETALKKCGEHQYDLILMDIEMKPLSGFEVAATIREECINNKETTIIAMSGYLTSEFDKEMDKKHFSTLVLKPFEPNELYRQILKYTQ